MGKGARWKPGTHAAVGWSGYNSPFAQKVSSCGTGGEAETPLRAAEERI